MQMDCLQGSTILITGGTGFLGSSLVKRLATINDIKLIILKRTSSEMKRLTSPIDCASFYDIETSKLELIFERYTFDFVIHCATHYGNYAQHAREIIDSALTLPVRLLQLSLKHNKPTFINIDTVLDQKVSDYVFAKKQFLEWVKLFSSDLPCINVSLTNLYGPFDNPTKFCTYIIWSLLKQVTHISLTPGQQKRDFIYISDVVDALVMLMTRYSHIELGFYHFEVGTGTNTSIEEFVTLVKLLTRNQHTHLDFGAFAYRPYEVMEYQIDTGLLQKLGWQPQYDLVEGLIETIQFEKQLLSAELNTS